MNFIRSFCDIETKINMNNIFGTMDSTQNSTPSSTDTCICINNNKYNSFWHTPGKQDTIYLIHLVDGNRVKYVEQYASFGYSIGTHEKPIDWFKLL